MAELSRGWGGIDGQQALPHQGDRRITVCLSFVLKYERSVFYILRSLGQPVWPFKVIFTVEAEWAAAEGSSKTMV